MHTHTASYPIHSPHRFIRALCHQPVDRAPMWLMRQAGRYLPEYRAIRHRVKDFLALCKNPELACEVTLQPLARFPLLDAAIVFSDILVLPEALGMKLAFVEGEGPQFESALRTAADIQALPRIDPKESLAYVMDTLRLVKQSLAGTQPLIGFAGSPWTLATYMVEGGASKTFSHIKNWMFDSPESIHALLAHLTRTLIDYLSAQIEAGADALMIFDSWGGILPYQAYLDFSLHYMQQIIAALKVLHPQAQIPIIIFSKNTSQHLLAQSHSGCTAIALDWTASLKEARQLVGGRVALQGNLDPTVLAASPPQIEAAVRQMLDEVGPGTGWIFNLGHGVLPTTDPDHVAVMLEAVQRYSPMLCPQTVSVCGSLDVVVDQTCQDDKSNA